MYLIVASLAEILQIIMVESNVWIAYVCWCNVCLVMDNIPKCFMALLAQPAVNALPLGYVRGSAPSPCLGLIKAPGIILHALPSKTKAHRRSDTLEYSKRRSVPGCLVSPAGPAC